MNPTDASGIMSLCLQSREGRKVISIKTTSTAQELYERAAMEFGGATVERIKGGFPPKTIPSDGTVVISSILSNQERLQVEFAVSTTSTSNSMSTKPGESNKIDSADIESAAPTRRKSKRAASKAATKALPDIIKAQEEMLKLKTSTPSKKRSRAVGNGVVVDPPQQPSKQRKSVKLAASAGVGRRLADGGVVASPPNAAARRAGRTKAREAVPTAGTDLSEALLGALNDKGRMGIILRTGMKSAVQASYETTRSFSRLASIQGKWYQVTKRDNNTSSGDVEGGGHLRITYRGSVEKIQIEETVDCIPRDVLQNVLEGIHASNREALRPENLARLSPRVLWSCAYYYPNETEVSAMYQRLLPDLDWSFLRRRAVQLSEKAMENKRQEEMRNTDTDTINLDLAADAVAAVENAMHTLQDYETNQRKARTAQAALARLRHSQEQIGESTIPFALVTPVEPDEDELRLCIESYIPSSGAGKSLPKPKVCQWIKQLMKECQVRNWRELANVQDAVLVSRKLQVPEENVQAWIDHAQTESLSEIIVEICDGNVGAVDILSERARSGTPKDLAAWRAIPDVLLDMLRGVHEQPSRESNDNHRDNQSPMQWMELGTISKWCERAFQVLREFEWLNWYVTPIA